METPHVKTILITICVFLALTSKAQLKKAESCSTFVVDILDGNVNGVEPQYTRGRIKQALPCSTSEESDSSKCGGAVNYKDKDIYFYTGRHYIEIREKFKGKLSLPIMGANRNGLFKMLGHPAVKDTNWDAFKMSYGTLVLHYSKAGKVNKIQFSRLGPDGLTLCE